MEFEEDSWQVYPPNINESISNREQIRYELLLDALQSKNFYSFKNLIIHDLKMRTLILNINYEYSKTKETFLDIASRNGLTEFVEFLLEQKAEPNRVNILHNRAPIHFATEGKYVKTLAALLNEPKTDPNLEAGFQTALHFAVINNDLNCARLLLEKGASANIPNNMGLTALHLAAMERQRDMVQLILEKSKKRPNVDTYKDCTGKTTRKVIQENLGISLPEYESDVDVQVLKYYLIVNNETNFLKNIQLFEIWDLYNAAEMLLEMAAQRGFHKAVISILKIMKGKQFSITKSAQEAIWMSNHVVLQVLLEAEPEMANDLILDACKALEISGRQKADQLTCLKLILKQRNVNVRCSDSNDNTPLHYATKAGNQEAMTLLLNAGCFIGHMNSFNEPPIAYIPIQMLSRYFDECLQPRRDNMDEYSIEFNYRCLMPHDVMKHNETCRATREMEVFKYIANDNRLKHLLKHPLLSSFLDLKWHRIRYVLYANLAFYVIFYCMLNAYILSLTYDTQIGNELQTDNGSPLGSKLQVVLNQNNFLQIVTAVMLLLFILREAHQFALGIRRYLTNLRSWLQIALIIFTFALLCGAELQIGVIVILLSAWELMILISQHPHLSIGIEMFQMVSFDFMRFLFPYLFLILSFALAFYILFKDDMHFSNPGLSLFKTVIMLTGEFDASVIPFNLHPVWSHIVFILFIFFIAIVLLNLLIGLAVSNTTEILSKTELVRLISRTRLLADIEDIIIVEPFGRHSSYCYSRLLSWNLFGFLTKRILLFPILRNGKINIITSDDNRYIESLDDYRPKYKRKEIFKPREDVYENVNENVNKRKVNRRKFRWNEIFKPRELENENVNKPEELRRRYIPMSIPVLGDLYVDENEDVNEDVNEDINLRELRRLCKPESGFVILTQSDDRYVDKNEDVNEDVNEDLKLRKLTGLCTPASSGIRQQSGYVGASKDLNEDVNGNGNENVTRAYSLSPTSLGDAIEPLRMDPYIFKEAKRIICNKKWMMKRS